MGTDFRRVGQMLTAAALAAAVASAGLANDELDAPIPSITQPMAIDSGWLATATSEGGPIYATVVAIDDVDWLRLDLGGTSLGEGASLLITSLKDGAEQRLDAVSLLEWSSTSAYFNGHAVLLQLFAAPGTRCRVRVPAVTASAPSGGVATICGPTDDRIASTDPREARLMPVGCTAWLFNSHPYDFLTAGHCLNGTVATVVEFNVPASLPNGTLQHPPPSDQYSVDGTSKQFFEGAVGNDWAYFGAFKNSTTFLAPLTAQGSSVTTALPPPAIGAARVTGYGTDTGAANQTNQTATGPFVTFSGTTLTYSVDTEGGNSGSPILRESDGKAIGIHTNGGCSGSGGSNAGTSMTNAGLQAALAAPKGISLSVPMACGMANAGTCFTSHASPACQEAACCQTVCSIDPFCCQSQWDTQCAGEAAIHCASSPCDGGCLGDLNEDGKVAGADISILLTLWGGHGCGDLNADGSINAADIAVLIAHWGDCP